MAEQDSNLGQRTLLSVRWPHLYYGWIVVGTLAITEPISWGILYYGFGVMLTPMQQELGWTQAELTGAFSLMVLVSGLMAVPVGHWIDRHGARGLMTFGSCCATIAIIAWAQVQTLASFYLVWIAIGVICSMILYEPAFTVTAIWFERHRSQALTLLTLGGGLASVIFVPLAAWLVQLYDWRVALWILAAILAVTTIPLHALILRRGPRVINRLPDGDPLPKAEPLPQTVADTSVNSPPALRPSPAGSGSVTMGAAVRQKTFWQLSLAFALSSLAAVALSVHLLPFLMTQGYPSGFAALTASVLGGSQIPGRLFFGPLGSRLSLRFLTALFFAMMTTGLCILMIAPAPWQILLGASLFGMGSGASSPARAAVVGEVYGITSYGTINGAMTLVRTVAGAGTPLATGLLYTWTGGYTAVFWVLILSAATAVLAISTTSTPSYKETYKETYKEK